MKNNKQKYYHKKKHFFLRTIDLIDKIREQQH